MFLIIFKFHLLLATWSYFDFAKVKYMSFKYDFEID